LLNLLAGHPLAMEVVLANLSRQTPAEALSALQAKEVTSDKVAAEKTTESLLRSMDYAYGNLSPEAQGLLLCLAPFSSVIFEGTMEQYIAELMEQQALAHLSFDRWTEVLGEAVNWGLISRDPDVPGYLRLHLIFPSFLRACLNASGKIRMRSAVETAFRRYYDKLGEAIAGLLQSKGANEKLLGQAVARLEYENLVTALNLTLSAQQSIFNINYALSLYLYATQDHRRGLELGEMVLAGLEKYPSEILAGRLGEEFVVVIESLARLQFSLKQYTSAWASYQKALRCVATLKAVGEEQRNRMNASIYHQLGIIAQIQRQWEQAEQYYKEALAINIEFGDRHSQAVTYHQLGRAAQEQRQLAQAEQYYKEALAIFVEFQDRYEQAGTYHQLGGVAQEQRQWAQAEQYYKEALAIFVEFQDRY
jgi:tetratricopeptide (TPR) repeat protein